MDRKLFTESHAIVAYDAAKQLPECAVLQEMCEHVDDDDDKPAFVHVWGGCYGWGALEYTDGMHRFYTMLERSEYRTQTLDQIIDVILRERVNIG